MTHTVIHGSPQDQQHLREDGTPWPYALSSDTATLFADSVTEVVGALLEGYDLLPDTASGHDLATVRRAEAAVVIANEVQALLAADATQEGRFDPSQETEETLTAIFRDRTVPFEEGLSWTHEQVPLVLLTTDYQPFVDRVPVNGNVLWVDPSDELAFLRSLAHLGYIDFLVHGEDDATQD